MAYGSGLLTPYFSVNDLKNSCPSGGYLSGVRVATVHLTCGSSDFGMPPSFSETKPVSQTPSGPYMWALVPRAAPKSLNCWTALLAVMPEYRKQSAPAAFALEAIER